jgi:hypothetical protein
MGAQAYREVICNISNHKESVKLVNNKGGKPVGNQDREPCNIDENVYEVLSIGDTL